MSDREVTLTMGQLQRHETIRATLEGRLTGQGAAEAPRLSRRQVERLKAKVRTQGPGRALKSSPFAFQWSMAGAMFSRSTRPTMSSIVRKPSAAMCSRSCRAMNRKNRSTYFGLPLKRFRRSGACVATPTGQVFRWHLRIHDAAARHQDRRAEAELLGPEQGGDGLAMSGHGLRGDGEALPTHHGI